MCRRKNLYKFTSLYNTYVCVFKFIPSANFCTVEKQNIRSFMYL